MSELNHRTAKGRGSLINPPNRFEAIHTEDDFEHVEFDDLQEVFPAPRTEYLPDDSKTVISENNSPDIPFRYSLNPYRGCAHGCSYCYARPTHEYLGFSAGLDFETKVLVKQRAPELLRQWLARDTWQPEVIVLSGVTDCYQPAEREFQLTRRCLEVAWEFRQPISIVTKNALVTRDLDVLGKMAERQLVHVALSITTLDETLARMMEPRTSAPSARLRVIGQLREAGVPVSVMVAPVIPGLNDSDLPAVLEAAAEAGASASSYILLRLPLTVRPIFFEWLQRTHPSKSRAVESRIRSCREGQLNDATFGQRMKGVGPMAEQIEQSFRVFSRRYGLDQRLPELCLSEFRSPQGSQLRLF